MLIQDFRMFEYITLGIAAAVFISFFLSFVSSKSPLALVLLSAIGMFLSSILSASSYNVIQSITLGDGSVVNNLVDEASFSPVFFSGLFTILFWFFTIMLVVGIFFNFVTIMAWKGERDTPGWKKRKYARGRS